MELRTFNSAADVRDYISALVDEGLAYHFDDDPYDVLDDYALAGVIDFNTMQMRDHCDSCHHEPSLRGNKTIGAS